MPGSLLCGARKTHSRHMRHTQFYVSGKRPMHTGLVCFVLLWSCYANHWENNGIVCTTSLNVFLKIQLRSGRNYWYHLFLQPKICGSTNFYPPRGTSQITLQKRPTSGPAPAVAATRGAAGSGQAAKVQTGYAAGRLRLSRHCRRRASIAPAAGRRRHRILPAPAVLQPACARLTYHPW